MPLFRHTAYHRLHHGRARSAKASGERKDKTMDFKTVSAHSISNIK